MTEPLRAVVWHDYVCPWAHAGRAHTAWLRTQGVEVDVRAYELHPETPAAGAPLAPGRSLDRLYDHIGPLADELGVPFEKPPITQNTRLALEVLEVVRADHPTRLIDVDDRFDEIYWREGGRLDDPDTVVAALDDLGLDGAAVLARREQGASALAEAMAEAAEHGVGGTPAWKVGLLVVPGLQDAPTFQRWMTRLIERHGG